MRRATTACGLAVAVVAAVTISSAPGRTKSFGAYPSCGARGERADRFCFEGDHPVAVFRATESAEVTYRVCVRREGERRRCLERSTSRPGKRSRTPFALHGPGRYRLAWFVRARAVDRDLVRVRRRTVFAVGDSLGEGTRPYLPRALEGWKVGQSASVGRHVAEGLAILRARRHLESVIVFALGTNDDPRSASTFEKEISTVLRLAGPTRCVVVPNIVRPPVAGTGYGAFNRALASLARRNRNLRVVDWAALVARHREWLAGDGVHARPDGYAGRARAIAEQVERC